MGNNLMQADLSVWGMYHHADIVVKVVMIGLILASVVTWAIFFGKGAEILASKRRLKREQQQLAEARSLDQASDIASAFEAKSLTTQLINEAQNELELSAGAEDNEGIKERTGFRHFPVCGSVWYRLGHHEQLYRHRPDPDHQSCGGSAGHRRSAAGDGHRPVRRHPGGGHL